MRQTAGGFPFAEEPSRPSFEARLLWDAQCDPSVLTVAAHPGFSSDCDGFDLFALSAMATVLVMADRRELVVLSDGYRRIRLDVVEGTLLAGPVQLRFSLEAFRGLGPKILTLQRLAALRRLGRFAAGLHPPERLASRWIAALRVHDAICAGASQRDIAFCLFGAMASGSDWRAGSECLRLRVQRLGRVGRRMVSGGYRLLLR
jgi:hypothetical protein